MVSPDHHQHGFWLGDPTGPTQASRNDLGMRGRRRVTSKEQGLVRYEVDTLGQSPGELEDTTQVEGNDLGFAWPGPAPPSIDRKPKTDVEFADWLERARPLPLVYVPRSDAAVALVEAVTAAAAEAEARIAPVRRGPDGRAKLLKAVGAVVGGLLCLWSKSLPCAGYRRMQTSQFTGSPVAARQFMAATVAPAKRVSLRSRKA